MAICRSMYLIVSLCFTLCTLFLPAQGRVCAQAKVRIAQDVVITRQGFEAALEIENITEHPVEIRSLRLFIDDHPLQSTGEENALFEGS